MKMPIAKMRRHTECHAIARETGEEFHVHVFRLFRRGPKLWTQFLYVRPSGETYELTDVETAMIHARVMASVQRQLAAGVPLFELVDPMTDDLIMSVLILGG